MRTPPRVASDRPAAGEVYGMYRNIMRQPSLPNERSRENLRLRNASIHFYMLFSLLVID